MNRITILQDLSVRLKAKTYVEIGVNMGHAFLSIRAPRKFGVDPVNRLPRHLLWRPSEWPLRWKGVYGRWLKRLGREDSRFFEMTSDDFFRRVPHIFSEHKIDLALIDGLHTYEQAWRDVENCLKFLSPNGVILMHDCNPVTEAMGVPAVSVDDARSKNIPGWEGFWCGDVWKAIVRLRTRNDLQAFVLDCDMGVGIVRKAPGPAPLFYTEAQIQNMDYKDLAAQRKELLGLQPESYYNEFLKQQRVEVVRQ